jgi:hypothetical protein
MSSATATLRRAGVVVALLLGPEETADLVKPDAARGVECVRGWRKVSSWDYVCVIVWPDGRSEEKYVNVDDDGVTDQTL